MMGMKTEKQDSTLCDSSKLYCIMSLAFDYYSWIQLYVTITPTQYFVVILRWHVAESTPFSTMITSLFMLAYILCQVKNGRPLVTEVAISQMIALLCSSPHIHSVHHMLDGFCGIHLHRFVLGIPLTHDTLGNFSEIHPICLNPFQFISFLLHKATSVC